jgi:excisionase family DNA binding protein
MRKSGTTHLQVLLQVLLFSGTGALTAKELATILGVTPITIYRQAAKGMPSYRIGRCIRFNGADVAEWLASQ